MDQIPAFKDGSGEKRSQVIMSVSKAILARKRLMIIARQRPVVTQMEGPTVRIPVLRAGFGEKRYQVIMSV
jgi:hypothetical protein